MDLDPRLIDCLLNAEDLRANGLQVSPKELCKDCPDLEEEFVRQLQVLADVDAVLDTQGCVEDRGSTPSSVLVAPDESPDPPLASVSTRTDYRVLGFHDRGGLGEVLVANDETLQREVALKRIQKRRANDPKSRSRFLGESEITARLEHPGIVPVYGSGTYDNDCPF